MGKIKLLKALSDEMFVQIANKNAGLTRRELAKKLDSLGYGTSPHPYHKNQTPLSFKQDTGRTNSYFTRANKKNLIEQIHQVKIFYQIILNI